ncbi:MAG: indole-3-glycerol phosphate synthase TrpC [Catalinimonas sp.]
MNILEEIVGHRQREVAERQALYPVALLEKSLYFATPPVSLRKYLQRDDKTGVIAEFKRRSPSRGVINAHAPVERTTVGYMQAGAAALSILTETKYFGGRNEDLETAREFNFCPILRKDFVVDEYQLFEAKAIGADAVLLIAAALTPAAARTLATRARDLGLEVLLEVHSIDELRSFLPVEPDLIGVNNRDLTTFETTIRPSLELAEHIPSGMVRVSESGLSDPAVVRQLYGYGYRGFLIGETFMRHGRPERACADFTRQLKALLAEVKPAVGA